MRTLIVAAALLAVPALAQESEFKGKMQEDLDGYKAQVESNCGIKPTIEWTGGKLGHNPRESEKPEWNGLSTLCTSAIDGLNQACTNAEVKKAVAKVTKIQCAKGKGTIGYKLAGGTLTFTVDGSFVKNNAAGQESDLVEKLKKDLDT